MVHKGAQPLMSPSIAQIATEMRKTAGGNSFDWPVKPFNFRPLKFKGKNHTQKRKKNHADPRSHQVLKSKRSLVSWWTFAPHLMKTNSSIDRTVSGKPWPIYQTSLADPSSQWAGSLDPLTLLADPSSKQAGSPGPLTLPHSEQEALAHLPDIAGWPFLKADIASCLQLHHQPVGHAVRSMLNPSLGLLAELLHAERYCVSEDKKISAIKSRLLTLLGRRQEPAFSISIVLCIPLFFFACETLSRREKNVCKQAKHNVQTSIHLDMLTILWEKKMLFLFCYIILCITVLQSYENKGKRRERKNKNLFHKMSTCLSFIKVCATERTNETWLQVQWGGKHVWTENGKSLNTCLHMQQTGNHSSQQQHVTTQEKAVWKGAGMTESGERALLQAQPASMHF